MSNTNKNFKELQKIKQTILQLCKAVKDESSYQNLQSTDFTKLERKLFSSVVFFLLKAATPDLAVNFDPVANLSKPHGVFVKELFQTVCQVKERYPWSTTMLQFQKSHFQDVRPENDKLVDFIKQLVNVAIYIVTKTQPGHKSAEQLRADIQTSENEANLLRQQIQDSKSRVSDARSRYHRLQEEYSANAKQLIDAKLFSAVPNRAELLTAIESHGKKLLEHLDEMMD